MPVEVTRVKPSESGSGGILGAIGAALGVIAAPFTGGASLAATAGLAGTGAAIGSTVGNIIDPGEAGGDTGGPSAAISRRAAQLEPQASVTSGDSSAILEESLKAIKSPDVPHSLKQEYEPVLNQAYDLTKRKVRGIGTGVVS